jgi:hypothetical protein
MVLRILAVRVIKDAAGEGGAAGMAGPQVVWEVTDGWRVVRAAIDAQLAQLTSVGVGALCTMHSSSCGWTREHRTQTPHDQRDVWDLFELVLMHQAARFASAWWSTYWTSPWTRFSWLALWLCASDPTRSTGALAAAITEPNRTQMSDSTCRIGNLDPI